MRTPALESDRSTSKPLVLCLSHWTNDLASLNLGISNFLAGIIKKNFGCWFNEINIHKIRSGEVCTQSSGAIISVLSVHSGVP